MSESKLAYRLIWWRYEEIKLKSCAFPVEGQVCVDGIEIFHVNPPGILFDDSAVDPNKLTSYRLLLVKPSLESNGVQLTSIQFNSFREEQRVLKQNEKSQYAARQTNSVICRSSIHPQYCSSIHPC